MLVGQLDGHIQKKEVRPLLHNISKNELKRDQVTKLSAKTIKLLKENLGINLCYPGLGHGFLDMTPKALVTK